MKGEKYAGKKVRLNRVSNSQTPGHESDTLTTGPAGRGSMKIKKMMELDENEDEIFSYDFGSIFVLVKYE